MTRRLASQNQCQTLSSCASVKMFSMISAICSHKPQKISREDLWKEDIDSCNRRTPTHEDMISNKRLRTTRAKVIQNTLTSTTKLMETTVRTNSKTSILMRSQRTSKVRKKT